MAEHVYSDTKLDADSWISSQLWGSLRHPNIVALLGTCVLSVDGITELCPVFRWIGLGSVKDLINSGTPFDPLKIVRARCLEFR